MLSGLSQKAQITQLPITKPQIMQLPKTETALNGIKCSRTANDQIKVSQMQETPKWVQTRTFN